MIPSEIESLMQEVLDGTADPEDRERLESWLREHPEGQARRAELEALFADLGRVPLADAPADLAASVTREVRLAAARTPRGGRFAPWAALFARQPSLALGLPFAAGLVVGALVLGASWGLLLPGGARRSELSGSMLPPGTSSGATDWSVGADRLEMVRWRSEGSTRIRLRALAGAELLVEFHSDAGSILITGVEQSSGTHGAWTLDAQDLRWRVQGPGELRIECHEPPSTHASLRAVIRSHRGERTEVLLLDPNP